jgi:hypothetical protein
MASRRSQFRAFAFPPVFEFASGRAVFAAAFAGGLLTFAGALVLLFDAGAAGAALAFAGAAGRAPLNSFGFSTTFFAR